MTQSIQYLAWWLTALALLSSVIAAAADESNTAPPPPPTSEQESQLEETESCQTCNNEISIEFAKKMSKFSEEEDFIREFVDIDSIDTKDSLYHLINATDEEKALYHERSVAIRPKAATCVPDFTVVSLRPEEETDPTIVYFPSCTRVKKCGGCCSHKLLSCQPTETQMLTFEVIKSQYTGGTKMVYRGKEIIPVEEHLKCKCDCAVQEQDCNPHFQRYDKSQCKCYCTNVDDQQKCLTLDKYKLWDPNSCTCRCRETLNCPTGSYFDQSVCKCLATEFPMTTVLSSREREERRRLIVKPSVVYPTASDQYIAN